jgi:hypothetical protein
MFDLHVLPPFSVLTVGYSLKQSMADVNVNAHDKGVVSPAPENRKER